MSPGLWGQTADLLLSQGKTLAMLTQISIRATEKKSLSKGLIILLDSHIQDIQDICVILWYFPAHLTRRFPRSLHTLWHIYTISNFHSLGRKSLRISIKLRLSEFFEGSYENSISIKLMKVYDVGMPQHFLSPYWLSPDFVTSTQ